MFSTSSRPSTFRALKTANYRIYFSGQLVSLSGGTMQELAEAWLVYRLSGSALWLGAIAFANKATAFAISPLAGVCVDRYDRKKLLLVIQLAGMVQAFGLAALVLSGRFQVWQAIPFAMLLGVINGFESLTRHVLASDLVRREDINSAVALNSATANSARILGPALGGMVLIAVGEGWCFFINGVSYLAVVLALLAIRLGSRPARPAVSMNVIEQTRGALAYVQSKPRIKRYLLLSTLVCFVGYPYLTLLPVFAKQVLSGDANTLAWLSSTSGAGAVLGAFRSGGSALDPKKGKKMTMDLFLTGVSLMALGFSDHIWLSCLGTFGIGFFMTSLFPRMNATIQNTVEEGYRGRVMSLYTMTFLGAMPIGSLISGWAADSIGVAAVTIVAGIILFSAALAVHCKLVPERIT